MGRLEGSNSYRKENRAGNGWGILRFKEQENVVILHWIVWVSLTESALGQSCKKMNGLSRTGICQRNILGKGRVRREGGGVEKAVGWGYLKACSTWEGLLLRGCGDLLETSE